MPVPATASAIRASSHRSLLRRYLGPQRGAVALMVGLLVARIGFQLAGPQVARTFIDAVQAQASEAVLIQTALLFIALSAIQQAANVLATYWSEHVAWSATNALRADLVAHLLGLDLSFHHAHTPGELIERVDGDVSTLAQLFASLVTRLVASGLLLAGVLVAVTLLDGRLGLAYAVFTCLALGGLAWLRRFAARHWQVEREHTAGFYGYVGEVLAATEDLRANGAGPFALHGFYTRLCGWLPARQRAELWGHAVWIAAIVVFAGGDALAYGLGGGLFQSGAISLGAVYVLVAYTAMLAEPIEAIRTELQNLQQADAGLARVRELLAVASALPDGSAELPAGPLAVEFHGVSFGYAGPDAGAGADRAAVLDPLVLDPLVLDPLVLDPLVLDRLTLRVDAGRVLGVVGRTGSGKTTLARLLFRLVDPQHGQVRLGGLDVRQVRRAALRARVGLVTQDVQIFDASLRDNLTFFDAGVPDARLDAVLRELGLADWLARLPFGLDSRIAGTSLSAGEAQLIALARVFLKDPGLVILDEASSRLDPGSEARLARALDRLLAGRTVVIIAHRPELLARADQVLALDAAG